MLIAPVEDSGVRLSEAAFVQLAQRIEQTTGIKLGPAKRQLVQARVGRRLRALALPSFDDYLDCLASEPEEMGELVSAITTNLTHFFREPHHFQTLSEVLRERPGLQRVWSSACSTGEEAYSIAMTALEAGVQAQVVASDVDAEVLSHAREGVYDLARLAPVSLERKKRFFEKGLGPLSGKARVKPELRARVAFESINLISQWPAARPYDAVFCRNVLIYFDVPTQIRLVQRLIGALRVGGVLFLGHSESLREADPRVELVGVTTFRRVS